MLLTHQLTMKQITLDNQVESQFRDTAVTYFIEAVVAATPELLRSCGSDGAVGVAALLRQIRTNQLSWQTHSFVGLRKKWGLQSCCKRIDPFKVRVLIYMPTSRLCSL